MIKIKNNIKVVEKQSIIVSVLCNTSMLCFLICEKSTKKKNKYVTFTYCGINYDVIYLNKLIN